MTHDPTALTGKRAAAVAIVLAVAVAGGLAYAAGGTDYSSQQACTTQLGEEWEAAGVVDVPGEAHIHVKCERSTGLLGDEVRWITVERSETNSKTAKIIEADD